MMKIGIWWLLVVGVLVLFAAGYFTYQNLPTKFKQNFKIKNTNFIEGQYCIERGIKMKAEEVLRFDESCEICRCSGVNFQVKCKRLANCN